MSRSGYTDDTDDTWSFVLWRGAVCSAMSGKRGQAFLKDVLAALDAMPVKALIADELERDGEVCTIGALGKARGINMADIDPDDSETVAGTFGIAPALAREIVYENDEGAAVRYEKTDDGKYKYIQETPEERFARMRQWVASRIRDPAA